MDNCKHNINSLINSFQQYLSSTLYNVKYHFLNKNHQLNLEVVDEACFMPDDGRLVDFKRCLFDQRNGPLVYMFKHFDEKPVVSHCQEVILFQVNKISSNGGVFVAGKPAMAHEIVLPSPEVLPSVHTSG